MNLYGYVGNSSIFLIDVLGLDYVDVKETLLGVGLSENFAASLAIDIDRAGSGDTFSDAFHSAICNARKWSDSSWFGGREAGFTVGKNGSISPMTKIGAGLLGAGLLGTQRPEPAGTAFGAHSHFAGRPSHTSSGPNTMGTDDINETTRLKRPEIAIGAKDVTAYDPTSRTAKTMPLPGCKK